MSPEEKSAAVRQLLHRFDAAKRLNDKAQVSFQGFGISEYLAILHGLGLCSDGLPQAEQRRVIWLAVAKAAARGKLTEESFGQELRRLETEFLQKQPQEYVLVTSISIARGSFSRSVAIAGVRNRIDARLPRQFRETHKARVQDGRHSVTGEIPGNYCHVWSRANARTAAEATDVCLDAITLVRAIWNFYFNRQVEFRWSSDRQKPVNHLLLGPIHTLHLPNGCPASDSWWFDPGFRGPVEAWNLTKYAANLIKFEQNVRRHLRNCRYRADMEVALRRYGQSLDEHEFHRSFLHLWGVLEFLTGTTERDSRSIRRAAFLYVDSDYAEVRLKTLRDFRNRTVHAAYETREIEAYLFLLKQHVERLIEFHLASDMRFKSIAEASEFFDLPSERTVLERRLRLLRHKKQMLSRYGE